MVCQTNPMSMATNVDNKQLSPFSQQCTYTQSGNCEAVSIKKKKKNQGFGLPTLLSKSVPAKLFFISRTKILSKGQTSFGSITDIRRNVTTELNVI